MERFRKEVLCELRVNQTFLLTCSYLTDLRRLTLKKKKNALKVSICQFPSKTNGSMFISQHSAELT